VIEGLGRSVLPGWSRLTAQVEIRSFGILSCDERVRYFPTSPDSGGISGRRDVRLAPGARQRSAAFLHYHRPHWCHNPGRRSSDENLRACARAAFARGFPPGLARGFPVRKRSTSRPSRGARYWRTIPTRICSSRLAVARRAICRHLGDGKDVVQAHAGRGHRKEYDARVRSAVRSPPTSTSAQKKKKGRFGQVGRARHSDSSTAGLPLIHMIASRSGDGQARKAGAA